jgi:hypothetical protein
VPLHEVPSDGIGESLAEDAVDVPDRLRGEAAGAILATPFEQLGVEAVEPLDDGFFDATRGTCPHGHSRALWD